jgi:hypothetical protein
MILFLSKTNAFNHYCHDASTLDEDKSNGGFLNLNFFVLLTFFKLLSLISRIRVLFRTLILINLIKGGNYTYLKKAPVKVIITIIISQLKAHAKSGQY